MERVTDRDYALFLWIKADQMSEALEVIEEWGFEYKTVIFVWVKVAKGDDVKKYFCSEKSDWTQEGCSICLLATRGKVEQVAFPVGNGVQTPREFKELTVKLLGDLPALELFPDSYAFCDREQFSTQYDEKSVEWDMAAPMWLLKQLAEERRLDMNYE